MLPLDDLSPGTREDYFADGMTDELITELARIPGLRVVSRTSVMQDKGARKSLEQIARELKVDAIVEGSVVRSGDRVRITAQLMMPEATSIFGRSPSKGPSAIYCRYRTMLPRNLAANQLCADASRASRTHERKARQSGSP